MLAEPTLVERPRGNASPDATAGTITLDPVAWVEEPARIVIRQDAGAAPEARLEVTASRDWMRAAVGRPAEEMPRILPALSSVSAVAHHLASARALDQVFGATPPRSGEALRLALLQADFIRAHTRRLALLLAAPGSPLGQGPSRHWPAPRSGASPALIGDLMRGAVLAQEALEIIGGRVGLPVLAVPGGVARPLDAKGRDRLAEAANALLGSARRARAALDVRMDAQSEWQAFFDGEAFQLPLASLALFGEHGGVDWFGGQLRVIAPDGAERARFAASEYAAHIAEHREPWSQQPFAHLSNQPWPGQPVENDPGLFRVGPLARLNASAHLLSGEQLDERLKLVETHSVAASISAGLIELLDASEMLAALSCDDLIAGQEVRALPTRAGGEGAAAVEGPAGLVLHAYRTDARGMVQQVAVLDPAGLNHAARNLAANKAARHVLKHHGTDDGELRLIEFAAAAC